MRHLLFNLHGGLSAFGESAVQHARPASEMPTRSGVLGLVANCLGIERADAISINAISKSLGVGIAIYDPGSVMMDFHTTQTAAHPPQGFVSRAQQLKHGKLGTEISEREWRIGLIAVVALWSRDDVVNLDVIADALRTPKSIPFLGRKAAPTCAPMNPRTVDADTLGEAFAADAGLKILLDVLSVKSTRTPIVLRVASDADGHGIPASAVTRLRRDQTLRSDLRTFVERPERAFTIEYRGAHVS